MFRHKKAYFFFRSTPAICDSADLTSAEYGDPVAQLQDHIQILNDTDHCYAFFLLLIQKLIDHMGSYDTKYLRACPSDVRR